MSTVRECRTYWKDGSKVWRLDDITILADEPYYHLKLVQGKNALEKQVVDSTWFDRKNQVVRARVWRKVKASHG